MDCINNTQCSSPFNVLRLLPSITIPRYTTLSVIMPKIRDPKSKPHLLEVTTDRIMMIECEMRDLPHIQRGLSVLCGGSMCNGCNSASCLRHGINPHMCLLKFAFLADHRYHDKNTFRDMLSIHHGGSMHDVCSFSCPSIYECTALHQISVRRLHTIDTVIVVWC